MAARRASWPVRLLHWLLWFSLVLLGLAVIGASALSWRLARGPMDITFLAQRVEHFWLGADAPTHVTIGSASIAWNGFDRGADHGLELRLRALQLVDAAGVPGARLGRADLSLSVARLLQGHLVPRLVSLDGLRLRAVRLETGDVRLDLGGLDDAGAAPEAAGPSLSDVLGQLRRPATTDQKTPGQGLQLLSQLQHVHVHDARLVLIDQATRRTWQVDLADLELYRQDQGGVKGQAAATVGIGDQQASLQLKADLLAGGGTHLEAVLDPLQVAALAQASPALAPLSALDAKVQATATLDLSPTLQPRTVQLHLAAGGGTFTLANGAIGFERLALDAASGWSGDEWRPVTLTVQHAEAVLPSPHGGRSTTIAATADAVRRDGKLLADARLSLDHAAFADLGATWPEAWGGHVRPWLVENVTGGTAHDGAFTVKLSAAEGDPSHPSVVDAGGTMQAEDLTIHWLRPVPPIEHARAVLSLLGPDTIEIAIPSAAQGRIALQDGLIRITGLSKKDQLMALTAQVAGAVSEVLQLLKQQRLNLLSKHPIAITGSGGTLSAQFSLDMPMKKELKFEQVNISARGHLGSLQLDGLVAGRDLARGEIDFDVTQDGMHVSGPASVAGFSGDVDVAMDFRQGPPTQTVQRATMTGRATAEQLRAADADPAGIVTSGNVSIAVTYTALRDETAKVEVKAALAEAGLSLLGWRKPPGPEAQASGTLLLRHDRLNGVSDIEARGPGLAVVAKAEMIGDRPRLLRLERIVLGPSRASGEVRFPERPGQPIRIRLRGPELDLSSQLGSGGGGGGAPGKTAWVADISFERVLLAKGRAIEAVTAHAEYDGKRLSALDASSTGPERVRVVIAPQGHGRRLQVRAADAGTLFHAFDLTDTIHGGALAVDAEFDDRAAGSPLSGTVDMSEFSVQGAVTIGKLLQAITIYGIADAMQGEGVHFTRLIAPFRYASRQVFIEEARAYSQSLGITAKGWFDLPRNILDIRGTIVPAYAVNSALGRIPLIGRLFSPERGGGLVSVNYAVTGGAADPSIVVNPLSALTPGFLRGLFNIFH